MANLPEIRDELRSLADHERARLSARYFKTGLGEYGYGDVFLGLTVPQVQTLAQEYYLKMPLKDVVTIIKSKIHEERLLAILILVRKFKKATTEVEKEQIYNLYLGHTSFINNWDLVDSSAPTIVGGFLFDKARTILDDLVMSDSLWERRVAIIATAYFITRGQPNDTLRLAEKLLTDKQDLLHKAVGWMLREVGKKCGQDVLERFLKRHYKEMPRTMLRYSIEKFPEKLRRAYIEGRI